MTKPRLLVEVALTLLLGARAVLAVPPAVDSLVVADDGGETELSLGLRAEASAVRTEVVGFLGVSVPLERLAAPKVLAAAEDVRSPAAVGALPAESAPGPAHESGRRAGVQPLTAAALSVLARGALAAARRAEKLPERERSLDGLASRARVSALLPEVRFRAARTRDETLRLTPTTDDPYRFTLAGGDAVVLEGAATFRLSRLLFADEELAVERLRLERERAGERRIARVLERVLAWHAAVVRLSTPVDAESAGPWLELDAALVELDVLTAGWFGARAEVLGVISTTVRRLPGPTPPPGSRSDDAGEPAPGPLLETLRLSAKPPEPCLPMHETGSRTFKGALTR